MARFFAFFTLFHLSLTFFRPEVPFKFKSIQRDKLKDHCTLWKITPRNAMNFRNVSSCGTIINPHKIQ